MCIFCKIANGEIPSKKVYEDEKIIIINDINPQTKLHYLLIPKTHYDNICDLAEDNGELLAHSFGVLARIKEKLGLGEGFRVISNCGKNGCQSVEHIHIHILGGEKLSEKMG